MYPSPPPTLECRDNLSQFPKYPSKRNCYPKEEEIIEAYLPDEGEVKPPQNNHQHVGRKIVYNNNNHRRDLHAIEKYADTLPYQFSNQVNAKTLDHEYSYTYCGPKLKSLAPLQQQQQPHIHTFRPTYSKSQSSSPTSSHNDVIAKPNSIRALLTKTSNRKQQNRQPLPPGESVASTSSNGMLADRHTFTTCYGTQENIYEDVSQFYENKASTSASSHSIYKFNIHDELRHVQSQHDRIMGELNLSVETLIMPSKDEQDMIEERFNELNFDGRCDYEFPYEIIDGDHPHQGQQQHRHPHPHHERGGKDNSNNTSRCDTESGFSGSSSSGTSYSGSIRYPSYKRPPSQQKMKANEAEDVMTMRMSSLARKEQIQQEYQYGIFALQSDVRHSKNKPSDSSENLSVKANFWNKLGKLKISNVFTDSGASSKTPSPENSMRIHQAQSKSSGYHV